MEVVTYTDAVHRGNIRLQRSICHSNALLCQQDQKNHTYIFTLDALLRASTDFNEPFAQDIPKLADQHQASEDQEPNIINLAEEKGQTQLDILQMSEESRSSKR